MNQLNITGKVIHIGTPNNDCCGLTIAHYPDNLNDSYFEMGVVCPIDLFTETDFMLYDYVELQCHYVTLNKTISPKKAKLLRVIDKVVELRHE